MKKKFNITGLCIPEKHYMVDISDRVNEMLEMIEDEEYFTINRPRQYGKTTTLSLLAKKLKEKYYVIGTSFEGASDKMFSSEEDFCGSILNKFADSLVLIDKEFSDILREYQKSSKTFDSLSNVIRELIIHLDKEIVLLIDEVDKDSNSRTFFKFLGLLRNKYLARAEGKDKTFKSVILAGVHDIKNLKLDIRDINDARLNSPWNIAMDFDIDMSFKAKEISKMLDQYKSDYHLNFDTEDIAQEIYRLTNGYPYLVSRICMLIDSDKEEKKNWTLSGIGKAAKRMLNERNALFDDVIKNIKNNHQIEAVVRGLLFEGNPISYNHYTYEEGIIYGIFVEREGKLAIHNALFETSLYNYLLEQQNVRNLLTSGMSDGINQFTESGSLDMVLLLSKFREFMRQEYREQDGDFYEANGRLIFLSFIRPIINGTGFYFIEAQTRQNKRMDVVVVYGNRKYVIELKLWRGSQYEQDGFLQLADYLNIQKQHEGYMLTFGFGKEQEPEWITVSGKKVFNVIV